MSSGSWWSGTVLYLSTAAKFSRTTSLKSSITASRSCEEQASRYTVFTPLLETLGLEDHGWLFFFFSQVNSVVNQVAKFVAMASLGMVCGLLEEEVFAIQSEITTVLKTLNGYFYSQMSSSSECLPRLGNFNQSLQRPETADTLR